MSVLIPNTIRFTGRIWIDANDTRLLGPGRIELLEKIKEHGSISKAARAMNMSYRKAWRLIDELNQFCLTPAVLTQKGGEKGGGAEVTATGDALIMYYRGLEKRFADFMEQERRAFVLLVRTGVISSHTYRLWLLNFPVWLHRYVSCLLVFLDYPRFCLASW
ncbi:winged helix-turn-helix domain-containing protein [Fibrisoma limi]|nr:LysR family transcriptional regulator [Fibrisoma limi]